MSSIAAEKLYPPIIGNSIPAFYVENGTATIAVPFSMNRAVDEDAISPNGGLRLKIKTVQSNAYITTLSISGTALNSALTNRIAEFKWTALDNNNNLTIDFNKIKLGQFLKVQMAYVDNSGNVGYFSTVAITKYTSKPLVYIENADIPEDPNAIPVFKSSYMGVFQATEDVSERPYEYCFYLYNAKHGLVETSGWQMHNTSVNRIVSESIALDRTMDSYNFTSSLKQDEIYYLQYGVRTVNNLEVFSEFYPCISIETPEPSLAVDIVAENNFDEAYIKLKLVHQSGSNASGVIDGGCSIEICRAPRVAYYNSLGNLEYTFEDWKPLKRVYFDTYGEALSWEFKDFTVEQGVYYSYAFREYQENFVYSQRRELATPIMADFEDMFLYDGEKQLKIRFNPKVSSFKTTQLEQKVETLGSKHPFIFKNGIVSYKEFPVAGLISYVADNENLFLHKVLDLDLLVVDEPIREAGPASIGEEQIFPQSLDLSSDTNRAERIFKMKMLDWLNDGKIKLFKSPAEGNYLVRLLNISLSPEDRLGRMLHNVSMTACEVEDYNYSNLTSLNFINVDVPTRQVFTAAAAQGTSLARLLNGKVRNKSTSIELTSHQPMTTLIIENATNPDNISPGGFFLRLGENKADNRVFITNRLELHSNDSPLPRVYFNPSDNSELLEEEVALEQACKDLVGDAVINYGYIQTEVAVGNFYNIKSVKVKNKVETYIGPTSIQFGASDMVNSGINNIPQILKFFVLEFERKPCETKLIYKNSKYYDYNNQTVQITHFDPLQLYQVEQSSTNNSNVQIFRSNAAGTNLTKITTIPSHSGFYDTSDTSSSDYIYTVIAENGGLTVTLANNSRSTQLSVPPKLSVFDAMGYNIIGLGFGVYLKAAYQERTVTYNS